MTVTKSLGLFPENSFRALEGRLRRWSQTKEVENAPTLGKKDLVASSKTCPSETLCHGAQKNPFLGTDSLGKFFFIYQ